MLETVLKNVDESREQSLEGLKQFLCIPSISAQPDHKQDMIQCANHLASLIETMGMSAKTMPTDGHPVVVARNEHRPGRPTV